ncbi:MAG TPA: YdeI/OmpD-associated family protein [Thermoleophilaceae bacterium]|nr:YdeI/OmpD-associated family protein [Thermoleophilaceae bacterium]
MPADDLPILPFASREAWESWLEEHHDSSAGVWLKIAKKATGIETVTHAEALEEALCFGWIDGQRNSFDDEWFLQRFTPRRPRSRWSQINRDKADELIARGAMRPAGLREVKRAKADGRWDAAYASQSKIEVPPDLQQALEDSPAAKEFFGTLNSTNRYAVLYRIHDAKRPETRARRIEKFVAMLARGEKLHP